MAAVPTLTVLRQAPGVSSGPASLRPFFEPHAVAVVGVSHERCGVGWEIFQNLTARFKGPVFAVHPSGAPIGSTTTYARVTDIREALDLVIIAVPTAAVDTVVDDCVAKAVAAVVVITAGFGETGLDGRVREQALRDKVRLAGMRVVGPNCMGLVNTDPRFALNASFSPAYPPAGAVAFSSQSGALGLAALEYAHRRNLGVSAFVSLGNATDVATDDLIEYWAGDDRTRVILLYLESIAHPRRFRELARHVGKTKPIVAIKAGRSRSGARAASSHTGALAASDTVIDALFRDAGIIRSNTLEEMFDVAALLAQQPLPSGPRIAILTNAGGPGILAADACEARGLRLPTLAPATLDGLRAFLPAAASLANPVDMIATAPPDHYRRAIRLLLDDPGIDSLLVIFIPPLVTQPTDVAHAVADATAHATKPVLAAFFGAEGVSARLSPVPCYEFPESAITALAHAVSYATWRPVAADAPPVLTNFDEEAAHAVVSQGVAGGGGWLPPASTRSLLQAIGVPAAPTHNAADEDDAVAAARRIGYPVVLKGSGPDILHKTEAHLVLTDLPDDDAVRRAFAALDRRQGVSEVLVQPMLRGVEMFVGARVDEQFGPVVMCGSGGTLVELLNDVSCRLTPLGTGAAQQMLDEIRGIVRLRGFRGAPKADEAALCDILLRVAALVDACPDILELDLNPVMVMTTSAVAVDVRVRVRKSTAPPDSERGTTGAAHVAVAATRLGEAADAPEPAVDPASADRNRVEA